MCEITVKCPMCGEACLPRQELSCSSSTFATRVMWACTCGATVTLEARKPQPIPRPAYILDPARHRRTIPHEPSITEVKPG